MSFILIVSFCQFLGLQDKFVVIEVIFVAIAVMSCKATLSVLIVGVAELASVETHTTQPQEYSGAVAQAF